MGRCCRSPSHVLLPWPPLLVPLLLLTMATAMQRLRRTEMLPLVLLRLLQELRVGTAVLRMLLLESLGMPEQVLPLLLPLQSLSRQLGTLLRAAGQMQVQQGGAV